MAYFMSKKKMKKIILTRFNYPEEVVNMITEAAKLQINDLIKTLQPMVAGNYNSYVRDQVMLGLEMTGTMDAVLEDCFNGIEQLESWLKIGNQKIAYEDV